MRKIVNMEQTLFWKAQVPGASSVCLKVAPKKQAGKAKKSLVNKANKGGSLFGTQVTQLKFKTSGDDLQ